MFQRDIERLLTEDEITDNPEVYIRVKRLLTFVFVPT